MSELLVYGTGGMGREVAQLAADLFARGGSAEPVGFLSDNPSLHGTIVGGLPVVGDRTYVENRPGHFDLALAAGAPFVRKRMVEKIGGYVRDFPRLVHPSVMYTSRIEWGRGAIVCAKCSLTVDIRLGDFVLINVGCTIAHDCVIGDYVTIAPGANISGQVEIHAGCDIGTGATLIQGLVVGEWTVVGAGATVIRDVPPNCTAVGVPARPIKYREAGWQLDPFLDFLPDL